MGSVTAIAPYLANSGSLADGFATGAIALDRQADVNLGALESALEAECLSGEDFFELVVLYREALASGNAPVRDAIGPVLGEVLRKDGRRTDQVLLKIVQPHNRRVTLFSDPEGMPALIAQTLQPKELKPQAAINAASFASIGDRSVWKVAASYRASPGRRELTDREILRAIVKANKDRKEFRTGVKTFIAEMKEFGFPKLNTLMRVAFHSLRFLSGDEMFFAGALEIVGLLDIFDEKWQLKRDRIERIMERLHQETTVLRQQLGGVVDAPPPANLSKEEEVKLNGEVIDHKYYFDNSVRKSFLRILLAMHRAMEEEGKKVSHRQVK